MAKIEVGGVVRVTPAGVARVISKRLVEAEAARIAAVKARGTVPPLCGPEIPAAPARGPVLRFEPLETAVTKEGNIRVVRSGFEGRKALRAADIFDVMNAQAARRSQGANMFSKRQMDAGRLYRDLVERHSSAGVKCSSLEATGGGGSGGNFMDAVLAAGEEIRRQQRLIGSGAAMVVRRVRPSARGSRVMIYDRVLVDMVCLQEKNLSEVLTAHGWSLGGNVSIVFKALCACLERMSGAQKGGSRILSWAEGQNLC
ncbi:hypothetical protein AB9F26_05105 [Falsihalocynthiibacter sp. BN13B15]|uniref:hypothetical protein n=1 Tax=Falsihalocynthiibacter sp. BN13B15 TaxID=3240871 RepID=UPI00350F05D6